VEDQKWKELEADHAFNQDVLSPQAVQECWEQHGSLPEFVAGT
jgi:hypothetical protein